MKPKIPITMKIILIMVPKRSTNQDAYPGKGGRL
jgi:hypothetical protein